MAKILVIEDDPTIRGLLWTVLTDALHDVVEASDGETGLERFREDGADVVLTDLFMPGMPGLQFIERLLAEFPDAKVIAMSGIGSYGVVPEPLPKAEALGARRTLRKPFNPEDLLRLLDEVLADDRHNHSLPVS